METANGQQANYQIVGIADEAGDFVFLRSDDTLFASKSGTVAVSTGGAFSAQFYGYAEFGNQFADGSTHGTGNVTGTVQTQTSISAQDSFVTAANTQSNGTLTLTFDSAYDTPPASVPLAGTYAPPTGSTWTASVTIDSGGDITSGPDSTTGCTVAGTALPADSNHDVFNVTLTATGCSSMYSAYNGQSLTGMAALDTSASPAQLIIGAFSTTANLAIGFTLSKQ